MKKSIVLQLFALTISLVLNSRIAEAAEVSAETDPATFAFSGYAAHLRIQPGSSPWVYSLGFYSLKFPDMMREMILTPKPDNLKITLQTGTGLFIDRFLSTSAHEGLFAGLQIAHHSINIKDQELGGESKYNALIAMPRLGYRLNIGSNGLYLLPWAGVGYVTTLGDEPKIESQTYSAKQILPFATVHMGYTF